MAVKWLKTGSAGSGCSQRLSRNGCKQGTHTGSQSTQVVVYVGSDVSWVRGRAVTRCAMGLLVAGTAGKYCLAQEASSDQRPPQTTTGSVSEREAAAEAQAHAA